MSIVSKNFSAAFRTSQSVGKGIIINGMRHWNDFSLSWNLIGHLGHEGLLAFRGRRLPRSYVTLLSWRW